MDLGIVLEDSFAYAKDGLLKNPDTWLKLINLTLLPVIPIIVWVLFMIFNAPSLASHPMVAASLGIGFGIAIIIAIILSAFYSGYTLKILRGEKTLPPVVNFGTLFVDGIKYLIINFIYIIPAVIVFCITVVPALISMLQFIMGTALPAMKDAFMGMMLGILLTIIVAIILSLFAIIGVVRFARTGAMGEAFRFSAILATIRKMGWCNYIMALLFMMAIVMVIVGVFSLFPVIGVIIQFIITPFIGIFTMRYICLLYESAGTA